MASAELSRRVRRSSATRPLGLGDLQRREFHETLLEAATVEDLPGKWLEAGQNRPNLRARLDARAARSGVEVASEPD